MRQFYKFTLGIFMLICGHFTSMGQQNFFSDASESAANKVNTNRVIVPVKYRVLALDLNRIQSFLGSVPEEKSIIYNRNAAPTLLLPMPDGRTASFHVWESSIQEPALQAKFPEIRTYTGQGISDPYATIRFDVTPRGFHAQVLTVNGSYYIDPYAMGNTALYNSYFRSDMPARQGFICDFENQLTDAGRIANITAPCRGTDLRTYRLAVACTGEYAQAPGVAAGTNPALLHAAIVTTVNRVVGVYEKEVAIRMVLVANNNLVEYLNAATDPFAGNNNANTLINESQTVITSNIGSANFDIGHTFSTGGGGLAGLGVVCTNSQKARGITGSPSPTGDAYDIDYVAHEMGHQWGGNHSMAGCGSSPNSTKYEVGSGTTIQAYAGICGGENIQPNSDPAFHAISFDEISNYLAGTGGGCGIATPTGNNLPVIDPLPANVSIPISTPFTLTGSATDADNDPLSYCWEQWDFSGTATWNAGATAAAGNTVPLFKSRIPKATGSRTFPDIAVINAGYPANPAATLGGLKGETLSPVARPMKFRLTVRDNRAAGGGVVSSGGGGCQSSTVYQVNVVGTTPFVVTAPNGGESFPGSSTQTLTWNVAGTDIAPIAVSNVKISLSTDAGLTYPTVIVASTANDGSEAVTIPNISTTTARVKIEAIDNIFFDISNANFTITAATSGFNFNNVAPATVACGSATAAVTLATSVIGTFNTPIDLSATGNPAGTTISFSTNPLTPGNSTTVTLNNVSILSPGTYTVTINGIAGTVSQAGTVSFVVQPGTAPAISTQPVGITVCAGANAIFSVISPGVGLSYQWQVSNGGPFSDITGANSNSYTATAVTGADNNNQYQVIVSTLCGTATSNAVSLIVNTPPSITAQPNDAVICAGNNNTFTVTAAGSGLAYQWQESLTGCGGTFVNIPGATADSYTLTNVSITQDGYAYQCVVTGICAPTTVSTNCVTLSVSSSVGIVDQPVNIVACNGSNAVFTVTASGTGVNYQWQVSNGGPFTDIAGANASSLTLTGVSSAQNGNQYQAVLTNSTCTVPSITTAATLTVNELPAVTTQPLSVTVCAGSNTTFTAAGTGTNISYQWQVSSGGPFTDITGETNASFTATAVTAGMNNNQYQVVVSGTCTPVAISSAVILTVISNASVTTQPVATAVCEGLNTTFSVTGNAGGAPAIIYQWQVSSGGIFTDIAGANAATYTINTASTAINGNQYQVLLSNATCPTLATSSPVILTVNALPVITAAADASNICTGSPVVLTADGAGATGTYSWAPGSGLTGSSVTVNPSVNPSTPGVANPITYTVTGTDANGCVSTGTVTVTANPLPVVTLTASPSYTTILPGQTVLLTTSVIPNSNFVYTWTQNGTLIANTTDSLRVDIRSLGEYQVTVADPSGTCSNISNAIAVVDSITNKFYIYPNPNDGRFNIVYKNPNLIGSVTVFDSRGARIYTASNRIERSAYQLITVDLRPAAAGVYIIVLHDKSGIRLASEKVVVR